MLSDQGANFPLERLGYLLRVNLGHVGHAAEVGLVTPEDIGEASREVVHATILPLTVVFAQPLRACESANVQSSRLSPETFPPRLGLRSRGALFLVAQHLRWSEHSRSMAGFPIASGMRRKKSLGG
jgi:hypothetical protein